MSKKQWHWGEKDRKTERGRDREGEREIERESERDIETGKDMHSIIVSTGYSDPGAQVIPWDPCGKVHTFHRLIAQHKAPATYQIKNKMSLVNGTVRHIIVFYGFTFSGKV